MRRLALVVAAMTGACLEPTLVPCGDLVCPEGATCLAERDPPACAFPDAFTACEGQVDGALCEAFGVDGACDAGVCVGSTCGDGARTGREQCDGAVDDATCGDFRFYYGALTCNGSCLIDTSACFGTCGDGLIQDDQGEICDGAIPVMGCSALGYDYGHIACTERCGDTSREDCGTYRMRTIYTSGQSEVLADVFRDAGRMIISGVGRLVIIEAGVRVDHLGEFGTIASHGAELVVAHGPGLDRIDGSTLVAEPAPGFAMPIGDLAYAENGDLYAISTDGEVRRRAGGTWSLHSTVGIAGMRNLVVGATGELYAATHTNLYYFDAGTWLDLGSYFELGDLTLGKSGETIAVSSDGVEELRAGATVKTFVTDFAFDAVALGDTYFIASLSPGRVAEGRKTVYALDSVGATPTRVRRMPDGSVLAWAANVFELGPVFGYDRIPVGARGLLRGGSGGILHYNGAAVTEYSVAQASFTFPSMLQHIAATGDRVYVAMGSHLAYGTLAGGMTVEPNGATSIWGDLDGNMAKVANNGTVQVRAVGGAWQALPESTCPALRVYGYTLDELYVVRTCPLTTQLERWDGTSWIIVFAPIGSEAQPLADGTLAFAGSPVMIGRGTVWTEMPFSATTVSGTSATDLFLGGTTVSPTEVFKLGHWDGRTVAKVRYPGEDANDQIGYDVIYGDATTVVMSDDTELLAFGRFPVP